FYYMLRNKVYCGKIYVPEHQKEPAYWVDGLHDPIIDEITFQRVQDVIDGKKKNARHPAKRHELLPLRGFLKCPICNENLTGSVSKGNGGKYAYYHCRKGCSNRISSERAHELFSEKILSEIKVNDNIVELYVEVVKDVFSNLKGDKKTRLQSIAEQINELEGKIITIEDKLAANGIDDESFNRMNTRYREQIMSLNGEYELIKNQPDEGKDIIEKAMLSIRNLDDLFDKGCYDIRNLLLSSILNGKVYISKDECRTNELNKVIELLTRFNKGYRGDKNEKAIISDGLSTLAPPAGLEPATL
ncbi:MAG: recombinase family protein, partial [Flavobacteriales bacterium]